MSRANTLFKPVVRANANARALLVIVIALVTFGTIAVASSSEGQAAANGGSTWSIMIRDVAYLVLGFVAMYLMSRVRISQLVRLAPFFIFFGLFLLVAVAGAGVTVNGGTRWLNLKFILLQPSELFKLFTVIFTAHIVQLYHRDLGDWVQLAKRAWPIGAGAALIVYEPDIGTTSVVLVLVFVMLAIAGLSKQLLGRMAFLGVLGIGFYAAVKPYSFRRLISFIHANANQAGAGYQLLQSRIGLGAGGVAGLGLGHSREKWGLLPNPHTDFIFTIIGEELGLIGSLIVIALFVAFLLASVRIAQQCQNDVNRLIAIGITTWIVFEAAVNIASVVGGWAVTGIPLPFFSYGGTALISELAAVGLLYNVANDTSKSPDLSIREIPYAPIRDVLNARMSQRQPTPRAPQRRHVQGY